ncbi:hypothetical protein CGRA01v4_03684 [Colletotrichum graminicola]|nr:hypothetical protein CGRA01v4_03684 [Colletotrichum graminicola]
MREEGRWKKLCLGSDQLTWRRTDTFHTKSAAHACCHNLRHRSPGRPGPVFSFPLPNQLYSLSRRCPTDLTASTGTRGSL